MLAGLASVTVIAAGVIGWQITHKGPPSFSRGGQFAVAGPSSSTTSSSAMSAETTGTTATATTASTEPPTSTSAAASSSTATTARRSRPSTTATSRSAAGTATTRAPSGPAPTPPPTSPTAPTPAPAPAPNQPGVGKPAVGTYTWTVDGSEQAPFVGSRRYPERMTMVVHTGGGTVQPDQLVFDLTYSEHHAEREIVGFRNDGIYFDFEGGSVTFGPRTETSQADYEPPILQIPLPLQAGLSRSGVTEARDAGGKVSRTEDWKTTVVGQEAVTVGGATVNAWKVEVQRKFRPGSADEGFRNRTYWFDPARHLWVKYTEVFHGERKQAGFSFTYDSNLTAVLASFTP